VQQRSIGTPFIQREPPVRTTTEGDWAVETYASGYTIRRNTKARSFEVLVAGKTWITMSSPRTAAMPEVSVAWGSFLAGGATVAQDVVIGIKTEADLTITVDQDVEDDVFKRLQGDRARVTYKFTGGGTATFTSTFEEPVAPGGQLVFGTDGKILKQQMEKSRSFALPMTMSVTEERHVYINSDVQYANRRYEQITVEKLPNSFPTFDTLEGVKKFLEAQPKKDFLVLQMPDGKFVARAVDEEQMKRLAQTVREGRTDFSWLPKLARYNGKAATGQFLTFWLHGKEYTSPDAIRDLYYGFDFAAEVGAPGAAPECEVYRMGKDAWGRHPLTHGEAVMLLGTFDKMSKADVYQREVEGFPFYSLRIKGHSKLQTIDDAYFDGRDAFNATVPKYEAVTNATPVPEWEALFDKLNSTEVEQFIGIEIDREQDNPAFTRLLAGAKSTQRLMARMVWREVTHHANWLAKQQIASGIEQLKPYSEDVMLRGVVLTFAQLTATQKQDTLDFLGVASFNQKYYVRALSDPADAWSIAQGKISEQMYTGPLVGGGAVPPPIPVSLDTLRDSVREQLANLAKTSTALDTVGADGEFEFSAISESGEFGHNIRIATYRDLGITLDPKQWPHRNVSPGVFPDPLSGARASFGSLYDQIYANESNAHRSWDLAVSALKFTVMLVAMLILCAVAHVAGALVVAALGLEGLAAFAVYTATSALVYTGAELLQKKLLEGKNPTVADGIRSFIKNLILVGGFTKLGKAVEGASFLTRIGVMGSAYLAVSFVERMAEKPF
ncbi:MAG: hypothetical protein ACREPM_17560, partial [Gemmatimonadaceae bacterium]